MNFLARQVPPGDFWEFCLTKDKPPRVTGWFPSVASDLTLSFTLGYIYSKVTSLWKLWTLYSVVHFNSWSPWITSLIFTLMKYNFYIIVFTKTESGFILRTFFPQKQPFIQRSSFHCYHNWSVRKLLLNCARSFRKLIKAKAPSVWDSNWHSVEDQHVPAVQKQRTALSQLLTQMFLWAHPFVPSHKVNFETCL